MSNTKDIVYFELNNWMAGEDYPNVEPFKSWIGNDFDIKFRDEKWVEENKLCVLAFYVDMSCNFCITAKREWVEKNCPELLTHYKEFLRFPEEDGEVLSRFDCSFLEYSEENIGVTYGEDW